jgi:hypothetical protein
MLSGTPGNPSTNVSLVPFFAPFRKYLHHCKGGLGTDTRGGWNPIKKEQREKEKEIEE